MQERYFVFRCTGECKRIYFGKTQGFLNNPKPNEDRCAHCKGTLELVADSDKVRIHPFCSIITINGFKIAYFNVKCPKCNHVTPIPWLHGELDFDECSVCRREREHIDRIRDESDVETLRAVESGRDEREGYDY